MIALFLYLHGLMMTGNHAKSDYKGEEYENIYVHVDNG